MPRPYRARALRPPEKPEWLTHYLATGEEPARDAEGCIEFWESMTELRAERARIVAEDRARGRRRPRGHGPDGDAA